MTTAQDQQHPQQKRDRAIVDILLREEIKDYNLVELARLRIRYRNFPGARDIQKDLDLLLQRWELTEEQLYQRTRKIHAKGKVYLDPNQEKEQEDWS
jgi:Protein of unknown function (DUF3288)